MKATIILLCFLKLIYMIDGFNILIVMPFDSKSHTNIHEAVARALGSKGHKVTLLTPYPMAKQWPNVEWHQIGNSQDAGTLQFDIYESRKQSMIAMLLFSYEMRDFMKFNCENLYTSLIAKSIIEETTKKGKIYDIAMVDSFTEYALPLAAMAANYTMYISVLPLTDWVADDLRIPYPMSTLSGPMSHFSIPTTFAERLEIVVESLTYFIIRKLYLMPLFEDIVKQYLPSNAPAIEDSIKNISFIFNNVDPVMAPPRPSVPFVADIGGIHLLKAKPLPKEFEDFMQSSGEHGVILFSFGSYFDTRLMPKDMRDSFVKAFGRLKQKVIWKYHEPIEGISDNVKIVSWMPQRDILAHPKLRFFITHGGRLSSLEVIHHGVPIIGVALFVDQIHNVHRLKSIGMGLEIDIFDLNADRIYDTAMTMLSDDRYAKKAKELSIIFRDRQNSADDVVNYWTEYVIKHNGASHLKNEMAQKLPTYQYLLLDVYATIILFCIFVIVIFIVFIRMLMKIFLKKKSSDQKIKKTKSKRE